MAQSSTSGLVIEIDATCRAIDQHTIDQSRYTLRHMVSERVSLNR